MDEKEVQIEASWKAVLQDEFGKDYFKTLREFVKSEYLHGVVYPPPKNIFRAFDLCPFDKVEVVILGQDPYHGPNQANGLCFAVSEGQRLPPSLQNIFKELATDIGVPYEALLARRSLGEEGKSRTLVQARSTSSQCDAYGKRTQSRLASRQGMGAIHRCGHPQAFRRAREPRFYPVGQLRQAKRRAHRPRKASRH